MPVRVLTEWYSFNALCACLNLSLAYSLRPLESQMWVLFASLSMQIVFSASACLFLSWMSSTWSIREAFDFPNRIAGAGEAPVQYAFMAANASKLPSVPNITVSTNARICGVQEASAVLLPLLFGYKTRST